jgi:hypothetical protein
MEANHAEMQQIMGRLEKLERQNRWLVCGGLALVLSCSIVLLIAQKPLARSIEAEKFVLKDATGEVRGELFTTDIGPRLILYGSQHKSSASLGVFDDVPVLGVNSKDGVIGASLSAAQDGPELVLVHGLSPGQGNARLRVYGGGPNLTLKDSEGFLASMGSDELVTSATGTKEKTSAASVHLFGPKGNTLWSAP